jgi:hypothetical protein
MGFLGKIGQFAGNALKKVGEIGSNVVSKVGNLVIPAYRAANAATSGLIGKAIENIPVVGGIAKSIGKVLGNANTMNKISGGLQRVGAAGSVIGGLASKFG